MRLNKRLEICRIYSNRWFADGGLNKDRFYLFRYGDDKRAELSVSLDVTGYIPDEYIPVVNFGYMVEIEELDRRRLCFYNIQRLDPQNGCSTKEAIKDKESRSLIFEFVKRALGLHLKRINPPIIVRGPITDFKRDNYRYKEITQILLSHGYKQIVVAAKDMKYQPNKEFMENEESDEYWFFCKKNIEIDKLKNLIRAS